jgi:hypothetical protein
MEAWKAVKKQGFHIHVRFQTMCSYLMTILTGFWGEELKEGESILYHTELLSLFFFAFDKKLCNLPLIM